MAEKAERRGRSEKSYALGPAVVITTVDAFFADALFIWSEPSGRVCKHKSSVEGGELFTNVGKRVGGRDTVHKELCRGGVQLDGGSAGDTVKELRDLAVRRGSLHRIHGCDEEVVCSIAFDAVRGDVGGYAY